MHKDSSAINNLPEQPEKPMGLRNNEDVAVPPRQTEDHEPGQQQNVSPLVPFDLECLEVAKNLLFDSCGDAVGAQQLSLNNPKPNTPQHFFDISTSLNEISQPNDVTRRETDNDIFSIFSAQSQQTPSVMSSSVMSCLSGSSSKSASTSESRSILDIPGIGDIGSLLGEQSDSNSLAMSCQSQLGTSSDNANSVAAKPLHMTLNDDNHSSLNAPLTRENADILFDQRNDIPDNSLLCAGNNSKSRLIHKRNSMDDAIFLPSTESTTAKPPACASAPNMPFERDWRELTELFKGDNDAKEPTPAASITTTNLSNGLRRIGSWTSNNSSEKPASQWKASSKNGSFSRDCQSHDFTFSLKTGVKPTPTPVACRAASSNPFEKDWCDVNRLLKKDDKPDNNRSFMTQKKQSWITSVLNNDLPDSKPSALQHCLNMATSLHRQHPNDVLKAGGFTPRSILPTGGSSNSRPKLDSKPDKDFLNIARSILDKPAAQENNEERSQAGLQIKNEDEGKLVNSLGKHKVEQQPAKKKSVPIDISKLFAPSTSNDKPTFTRSGFGLKTDDSNIFKGFGPLLGSDKEEQENTERANKQKVLSISDIFGNDDQVEKKEKSPSANSMEDKRKGEDLSLPKPKRVKFGIVKIELIESCKDNKNSLGRGINAPPVNLGKINLGSTPKTSMSVNEFEFRRQIAKNQKAAMKKKINSLGAQRAHRAPKRIGRRKHMRIIKNIVRKVCKEISQEGKNTEAQPKPEVLVGTPGS